MDLKDIQYRLEKNWEWDKAICELQDTFDGCEDENRDQRLQASISHNLMGAKSII